MKEFNITIRVDEVPIKEPIYKDEKGEYTLEKITIGNETTYGRKIYLDDTLGTKQWVNDVEQHHNLMKNKSVSEWVETINHYYGGANMLTINVGHLLGVVDQRIKNKIFKAQANIFLMNLLAKEPQTKINGNKYYIVTSPQRMIYLDLDTYGFIENISVYSSYTFEKLFEGDNAKDLVKFMLRV